jgi:subtilisin family serine protease
MRFRGRDYTGAGIAVAVIDSGIDESDPRLGGAKVRGWNIQLSATGHALIGGDCADVHGHGTDVAAAIRTTAPDADLVAIRVMEDGLRTTADLMAAGIETAFRNGARVINLSMGTPNMGKALLLRDTCALAAEAGAIVIAAAHPRGERAYPADLPETVGVAAHPDCPLDKFYFFTPHRFTAGEWGHLSGKFLAHGHQRVQGRPAGFKGPGFSAAYLAGRLACLVQAMPDAAPVDVVAALQNQALSPVPELGYA